MDSLTLLYILLASAAIASISLLAVYGAQKIFHSFFKQNLPYLVSMSAGIFLVAALHLIEESYNTTLSPIYLIFSVIAGSLFIYSITLLFPESHHHECIDCADIHSKNTAKRMLIGDSMHNITDGILLVPIFTINPLLGLSATIGIMVHEIIQEIGEFFVYTKAGYSTRKALFLNGLSASTIFIGAYIGIIFSEVTQFIGPLLGFAGGVFLYIVIVDLIPDSYHSAHTHNQYLIHTGMFIGGIITMILLFGAHV